MARSRRAKSQSISSTNADTLVNGSMPPPPSPPASPVAAAVASIKNASPTTSRRKASSGAAGRTKPTSQTLASGTSAVAATRRSGVLQFLLLIVANTVLEIGFQSVASSFGSGDLASISKHSESWSEVSALLGWKVFTLSLYWFSGFDGKSPPCPYKFNIWCLQHSFILWSFFKF